MCDDRTISVPTATGIGHMRDDKAEWVVLV